MIVRSLVETHSFAPACGELKIISRLQVPGERRYSQTDAALIADDDPVSIFDAIDVVAVISAQGTRIDVP
jgi:hypothetical protein